MFEWDDANLDHIALHRVESWEVEEAFEDRRRIRFPAHSGRYGFVGSTVDGRLIAMFLERRDGYWRAATARDASERERRAYRRANR